MGAGASMPGFALREMGSGAGGSIRAAESVGPGCCARRGTAQKRDQGRDRQGRQKSEAARASCCGKRHKRIVKERVAEGNWSEVQVCKRGRQWPGNWSFVRQESTRWRSELRGF